ncbi:MAG: hypothetical protein WAU53_10710 [Rhodoplanes sp.]
MSAFCPDGYVPVPEAIARAAEYWLPERLAALERTYALQLEPKPDNSLETLARVLSQPSISDALRNELQGIVIETVHRLRNSLHQGELTTYYFEDYGRRSVSCEFWATADADGVIESGTYWSFGRPTRWYESRPHYRLFLLKSELDALLSEQPVKKRPLPEAKVPELVAALRKLDDLPNRTAQLQALCNMPDFREFKITDALFREAARQAPRDPGRKSRR